MDRLLTDSEIWNAEIIMRGYKEEPIYGVIRAQDSKTLKAVGEFLQRSCISHASQTGHNPIGSLADDCALCRFIKVLKSGEMPEEVKE
jgi:hypothetical protein